MSSLRAKVQTSSAIPVIIFCLLFVTTLVTNIFINNSVDNQLQQRFETDSSKIQDSLSSQFDSYTNLLIAGRGLFEASENVNRDEWKEFVQSLEIVESLPGIQGMGYAVFVPKDQLQEHINSVRAEGFPSYTVQPAGERDVYSAILYLEPFDERNRQAFGFDMYSEKTRKTAMDTAAATRQPTTSGKVILIQEIDQEIQNGFLIYVPYYKNDVLQGFIYSPFRVNNFMSEISSRLPENMHLEIYDTASKELKEENILYDSRDQLQNSELTDPKLVAVRNLDIPGRQWTLRISADEEYASSLEQNIPIVFVGLGLLVSMIVAYLTYLLVGSRDQALKLAKEITKDLQQEKNEALRLKNFDEAVLASIGEGLLILDTDMMIIRANATACRILGKSESQLLGKKLIEGQPARRMNGSVYSPDERPAFLALKQRKSARTILEYQRSDGSFFPASVVTAPIESKNKTYGVVEVFRDITDEIRLERAKDELVSLASHQMRTPLTAIRWFAEMLDHTSDNLSAEQTELLSSIRSSTHRMTNLVRDFLNVSRLELGRIKITPTELDVIALIEDELALIKPLLEEKQLTARIVSKSEKLLLDIDPSVFSQSIHNYLTNAIRYTKKPGSTIEVKVKQDRSSVTISVIDQGIGIPKKSQKNIFSRFYRASNAVKTEAEGSGLGLYLVQLTIEASGGSVGFKSKEGEGSTFFIKIPNSGMKPKRGEVMLSD